MRPRGGRLLAGVAVGTAAHLRQDPLIVRVAFAVLATAGIGVVAYGALWLMMPVAPPGTEDPTPVVGPRPTGKRQWLGLIVIAFVAVVLLGQLSTWGGGDVVLPLVLVAAGLAVIWRQLDTDRTLAAARASAGRWPEASSSPPVVSCCCWPRPASSPTPATVSPRRW